MQIVTTFRPGAIWNDAWCMNECTLTCNIMTYDFVFNILLKVFLSRNHDVGELFPDGGRVPGPRWQWKMRRIKSEIDDDDGRPEHLGRRGRGTRTAARPTTNGPPVLGVGVLRWMKSSGSLTPAVAPTGRRRRSAAARRRRRVGHTGCAAVAATTTAVSRCPSARTHTRTHANPAVVHTAARARTCTRRLDSRYRARAHGRASVRVMRLLCVVRSRRRSQAHSGLLPK